MSAPRQLELLHRAYAIPIDPSSQVDRMPGTPDAPCHCGREACGYPFCMKPTEGDEE